jgi:hypothetical protein
MSIVVWDGKSLACDRQATVAGLKHIGYKFRPLTDGSRGVMAFTGELAQGLAMMHWYESGAVREQFPHFQNTDMWSRLIVAQPGYCCYYEATPFAIPVIESFAAWGSGRDFALGALARGASAKQAVEIACHFNTDCGLGVDCFEL